MTPAARERLHSFSLIAGSWNIAFLLLTWMPETPVDEKFLWVSKLAAGLQKKGATSTTLELQ